MCGREIWKFSQSLKKIKIDRLNVRHNTYGEQKEQEEAKKNKRQLFREKN